MSKRSVLVVVPTLNERDHIENVIRQLQADLPDNLNATFVVADGGSADGTVDKVRAVARSDARVHLIDNPKRLQSAAVNLAVAQFGSDADVVVRCDAHGAYPRGFIAALVATLGAHDADSVVISMDSEGLSGLQKATAWLSNTPLGTGGSAHRAGRKSGYVDHGHHAAFRMRSFKAVGGYDETFSHNEDAEFDCRLRAAGGKIYLNADIRQIYYPRSTLRGMWRQYFKYGCGRSRTVRKHPGSIRLRQLVVPLHLVVAFVSLLLGVFVSPLFFVWPVLYLSILFAFALFLALRNKSLCGLLAAPAALTMHMAWALGFISGMVLVRQKKYALQPEVALG